MISLTVDQKRAIDRSKEDLVKAAESMLDDSAILEIDSNDLGDRQLSNLVAVALETESPAVVRNFILYQIGRDAGKSGNRSKGWNYRNATGDSLGDQIIEEIENGAVAKALETIPKLDTAEQTQLARIELVRHFLGFTSRYQKYKNLERKQRKA